MTAIPASPRARRSLNPLTTRVLLTCAAIGVAAGLLLGPLTLWATGGATALPWLYIALVGFWVLGPVIAQDLLRLPGVSLMTAFVVGLVQMAFGGPIAIVTLLMIGVLLEIPFAIGLYRYWGRWIHVAAAAVLFALYAWTSVAFFGIDRQPLISQLLFYGLAIASGVVAVTIALLVSSRLKKAGLGVKEPSKPGDATPAAPSAG